MEAIRTERRRRQALAERKITASSIEATRERCTTLAGFVREAWHVVEPTEPYVHGWHIDAICQHLEAVTYGELIRLLINVPPGMMKSLLTSVFWPAWEWGPAGLPSLRYMTTSYSLDYATRDSRRTRDLIASDWYQTLWPDAALVRSGETSFANRSTGWREAMPFRSLTGGRGHRVIIDDPHSTEGAESEADRKTAVRIFRESVPSRMVDPKSSAIVIIMQRLHAEDVAGVALSLNLGYEHLMLPMEFEADRRCRTSIGFVDPRTYDGELIFPERFPREVVDRDKVPMGSYAVAGQFQQRPTLREGGMFRRSWFNPIKAEPGGTRWVRYWDLAASKEKAGQEPAYTVGLKMGRTIDGRFVIGHIIRVRDEGRGIRALIKATAEMDGPQCEIGFPQDPGQAGKAQAQDLVLMLAGYIARAERESGDKLTRAEPFAAQAEAGNVDIVGGNWNDAFLDEAADFPGSKFKDQVDAASGAFNRLIGGAVFATPEGQFAVEPVRIPGMWTRAVAIETDHRWSAALWMAYDRANDTAYLYDAYIVPTGPLPVFADAIRRKGKWIPSLFDTEAYGRNKEEGAKTAYALAELNLDLMTAPVNVAGGVNEVVTRLTSGRLKVFDTLSDWFAAYRRFVRDEKGALPSDDHMMRATAMLVTHGLGVAISENLAASNEAGIEQSQGYEDHTGRDPITGY